MNKWRSVAQRLYVFIIKYCLPSGMTPPEAYAPLRDFERMINEEDV